MAPRIRRRLVLAHLLPFAPPMSKLIAVFLIALSAWVSPPVHAADLQLRVGTLAQKNSLYHRQLMEVGEAWRAAQGGAAKYVVYPDGSQGGEAEMARLSTLIDN